MTSMKVTTPEEDVVIKECLMACLEFFDDDFEFQTLFGLEKAVLSEIAYAWPNNKVSEGVFAAVNNCLKLLLNYPQGVPVGDEWHQHISVPPHKIQNILDKINCRAIDSAVYDRESLIQYAKTYSVTYLFFWGHQRPKDGKVNKSCLSQWYHAFFTVDDIIYPTAEHFMMAEKARLFGDKDAIQKILKAQTPEEVKTLGRDIRGFDEQLWSQKKFDIVLAGNKAKFKQNQRMAEFLDGTCGSILVEASPVDQVWGIGLGTDSPAASDPSKWKGQNLLGFILMKVRDEI